MDIEIHHKKFTEIIAKYELNKENNAEAIANFLTSAKSTGEVSAKDFADQFSMSAEEAMLFLSFIERGIKFKKENIDPMKGN